jgi:hypothetical protein
VWLTVVAKGDGVTAPFWPTAKPYQPDSSEFAPYTFACTGPIQVDADGDGDLTAAYGYARQIVDSEPGDVAAILERLESFDRAVAIQTASILLSDPEHSQSLDTALPTASEKVRSAIRHYQRDKQRSIAAQVERIE